MSDIAEVHSFPGTGLNSDDSWDAMPHGDSPVYLNSDGSTFKGRDNVVMDEGDYGRVVNMLGISGDGVNWKTGHWSAPLTQVYAPPSASCRIIGQCYDKENEATIFFLRDGNVARRHGIYRYYHNTKEVERILTSQSITNGTNTGVSPALNFTSVDHIDNPQIIGDGDDARLLYTDAVNSPRDINIKKAINFTIGSGTPAYSAITDDIISAQRTPGTIFTVAYDTDDTVFVNNVRDKLFQFTYRVVYDDYSYSTCVPYSDIPLLQRGTTPFGSFEEIEEDNFIRITISDNSNTEHIGYDVFVRNMDVGDGVAGDWKKMGFFETQGVSTTIDFYNNEVLESVDQSEISQHFDAVPQKSRTQALLNGNIICYGGITEGYDNDLSIVRDTDYFLDHAIKAEGASGSRWGYETALNVFGITNPVLINVDDGRLSYVLHIAKYDNSSGKNEYVDSRSININNAEDLTLTELVDAFVSAYADDPLTGLAVANSSGDLSFTSTVGVYYILFYYFDSDNNKNKTIKSGTNVPLYVLYYDDNFKFGSPVFLGNVNIPNNGEESMVYWFDTDGETRRRNAIRFEIDYAPPDWASYYQFFTTDSQIEDHFTVFDIGFGIGTSSGFFLSTYKGDLRLDLASFTQYLGLDYNTESLFNIDSSWYVRGISPQTSGFSAVGKVKSNDGDAIIFDNIMNDGNVYYAYEFIKYRNDVGGSLLKAVGPLYNIDASGNHQVETKINWYTWNGSSFSLTTTRNQNGTQSAIGILDFGNAYVSISYMPYEATPDPYMEYIETSFYNPIYDSTAVGYGRPALVDDFGTFRQQELNALRYGNTYTDNTLINNVFQFPLTTSYFKPLSDEHGRIRAMRVIGNVLKVFQDKKVTSIYLGQRMATDASGNQQVIYSNSLLDAINVSEQEYGTVHPGSVFVTQRNAYWFDWKNYGCIVRDSANGMINISNYKMSKYFRDRYNLYVSNGISIDELEVHSQYDPQTQTIYFTFIDTTGVVDDETIGFHEPTNRWFSFYGFTPEKYSRIGEKDLLSFKDGYVYYHNTDSVDRTSYYDENAEGCVVSIVANENPIQVKVFDSIEYSSNDVWESPNNTDIEIRPYEDAPNGMASRLKEGKYRLESGVYKSNFMKDMLSDQNVATASPTYKPANLFNGRELRGRSMKIRLENDNTEKTYISHIRINSSISK